MKFKTRTTIEFSDHSIKIFQSLLQGNNPLIFSEMLTIEDSSDEAFAQALLNLQKTKKLNLRHSQVILIIPRHNTIVHYLNLPSENHEELKAMVDLQAVNQMPYSREEVIIDFIPFDKTAQGYTKVFVIAVPHETVLRLVKILDKALISTNKIVPSSIGVWLWYQEHCASEEETVVIIDMDYERSEICICDKKRILASRPLSIGFKEIDAKQYTEFITQLDLTIAAYVKEQLGSAPSQVLLVSSMNNAQEFLTQLQIQYTTPFKLLRSVKDIALRKSFVWPKILLQESTSITSALGFLQSNKESSIDLTPQEIKAAQVSKVLKHQLIRCAIAVGLALVSIGFCLSLNLLKQNSYLNQLESKVKQSQKDVAIIKRRISQVNLLKSAVKDRVILIDVISQIYNFLPQSVVLTNLTLNQEHLLSFQGFTNKVGDINEIQKALVNSSYFDNVNLDYVNKRVTLDGELNYFKITSQIKFKGKANEEVQ